MEHNDLRSLMVRVGGRNITNGWDLLARYCGLRWSGGDDETWAFRYYDAIPTRDPDDVSPLDVTTAAALHPGLGRRDLVWFHEQRRWLAGWLSELPDDIVLGAAEPTIARHLAAIAGWDTPVGLELLTKVLHRKKPKLIPIYDRAIAAWYEPITGTGDGPARWRSLIAAIRDDSDLFNHVLLSSLANGIAEEAFVRISTLRVSDIIIWMHQRHPAGG